MFRKDPTMPPRLTELERPATGDHDVVIYFSRKPLLARNVELRVGSQFEQQNKHYIRALAASFGVQGADTVPFHELPYVGGLLVKDRFYHHIRTEKLSYIDAAEYVQRRTRRAA
jgi:hypothetical protein